MELATKTNIHFTDFYSLFSWDVKAYLSNSSGFNPSFPLVLFGEFLSKANVDKIKIEDNEEYKILGVRSYGKGVFENRFVKGSTLKMKEYYRAKANHLFWCKVDTKNGAFGVIKNDLADGLGSTNMTFAEINTNKINVDFLQLLFTSKGVMQYLDSYVTGTTNRKYIRPDQLLNEIKIPLPTLAEQQQIVDAYTTKIQQAQALQAQANNLEDEIEKYLFDALEVKFNSNINRNSLLQIVNFENTTRWDSLFLLGKIPSLNSKYNLAKFSDVIMYFNKDENKTIRVDSVKFPNDDFKYIGMEHIEKETGVLLDMPDVKGKEIKSQTLNIPKGFFIYGKLRPYLNKYWINETDFNNIICSSEFFVFKIKDNINKEYFKYVLSSRIIQNQIADKTSGARMPRINEDIFYDLQFPLPPINEQNIIANNIDIMKQSLLNNKTRLSAIIQEAEQEFEKQIFG